MLCTFLLLFQKLCIENYESRTKEKSHGKERHWERQREKNMTKKLKSKIKY